MSVNIRKRIHLIYGIVLIASIFVAGICLMAACYGIYQAGLQSGASQIYSPDIVAEAFSFIAVPVYICLVLVIGSFILSLALPVPEKKPAIPKNRLLILSRLQAKTDLSKCDSQLQTELQHQQQSRKHHAIFSAIVLILCVIVFLAYALAPGRWPEEVSQVTNSVKQVALALLISLILPFLAAVCTAVHNQRSLDKEIALMKQANAQAPMQPTAAPSQESKSSPWAAVLRYGILGIAIISILYGYSNNGFIDVIAKAAAICTECVGLG